MSQSLIYPVVSGNIGGDDIDPGCLIPANFPKKDGGGSAAAVALDPIQPLDPGCDAPVEQWPENRGPATTAAPPTFDEVRSGLPDHLQKFVDNMGHVDPSPSDSVLRRQAMKAQRLSRILGDSWSVKFCPATYIAEEWDKEEGKRETQGHLFHVWPNWFMDEETWGDDRAELGPMEDQIAKQLDAHAKRFSDAAKKLRKASAEAEFIKQQMEANKGQPWPSCTIINAVQPDDELTEEQAAADIDAIWPDTEASCILSDDEKQFFDQCMIRGMDDLLRGNAKKRALLLMASDSDVMSGNKTDDAWMYVRDCILRVRGAALMLTHERRAVLSGCGGTGRADDMHDIASQGVNWLLDFYKEKQ